MSITPWRLTLDQEKVQKLKQKLELTDLPDEVEGQGWDQGPPLSRVKQILGAWKNFDYTAFERDINEQPNFKTTISVNGFGDLDIHFIHQRNDKPNAIPLLFVHGWPGSFLEASKIKQLLADSSPSDPQFHLVAL